MAVFRSKIIYVIYVLCWVLFKFVSNETVLDKLLKSVSCLVITACLNRSTYVAFSSQSST